MKILYVATLSNTLNAFLLSHIENMVEQGHEVDVACNIKRKLNPMFEEMGCKIFQVSFSRSPLSRDNIKAYKKIKEITKGNHYDVVHVHTPIASFITRLAMKESLSKIIYTAHGFHFYKGAPLLNWITYYPIEKKMASLTNCIITINKEDFSRANKKFDCEFIRYIPGVGLDTRKIYNTKVNKREKRQELGVPKDSFIILSVGELNDNKNHETIIRALSVLNNPDFFYLICGVGPLKNKLTSLSEELKVDNQVKFLGFRNDIIEICKASDIFAFPSKREGLGVAALEAMASGLPIITSNVHGIIDYSMNGVTGFCFNPKDYVGYAKGINTLYLDPKMVKRISYNNKRKVLDYDLQNSLIAINHIYDEVLKK